MATMYIAEYEKLATDINGFTIQAGQEPAVAEQTVTTSGVTAVSAAFNDRTRFVRIVSTGIEHLKFGSAPTATTSNAVKIEADTPEFFGVIKGDKVAAINGV